MSKNKQPDRILCAVDFEHNSLAAEKIALVCARAMKAEITYCHAFFEAIGLRNAAISGGFAVPPMIVDSIHEKIEQEKREQLNWRITAIGAAPSDKDIDCFVGFGDSVQIIKDVIEEQAPRLLVMSKRRRTFFSEFMLGSIGNRILRDCPIDTLIVPDDEKLFISWEPKKCVVALSFDEGSREVWRKARSIATDLGATLKIVHVALSWEGLTNIGKDNKETNFGEEVSRLINEYESNLQEKIETFCKTMEIDRTKVEVEIRRGSVASEIFDAMEINKGDLMVVGASDAGKSHLKTLGSVASTIARSAKFPVFVVQE